MQGLPEINKDLKANKGKSIKRRKIELQNSFSNSRINTTINNNNNMSDSPIRLDLLNMHDMSSDNLVIKCKPSPYKRVIYGKQNSEGPNISDNEKTDERLVRDSVAKRKNLSKNSARIVRDLNINKQGNLEENNLKIGKKGKRMTNEDMMELDKMDKVGDDGAKIKKREEYEKRRIGGRSGNDVSRE